MLTANTVVFIESNTTGTGADFIMRTLALGLTPLLLTTTPDRFTYPGFPHVRILQLSEDSVDAVISCLDAQGIKKQSIVGVMSTSDRGVEAAADTATYLGLPGPDQQGVHCARRKIDARDRLHGSGLNPWYMLASEMPVEQALCRCPTGLVVKPVSGTGSMGVFIIHNERDLVGLPKDLSEYMYEERIPGQEYSVEFINGTFIGACKKITNGRGLERGHDFPAPCAQSITESLQTAGEEVVNAFGLDNGAAHVELITDSRDGSIKMVEVNPRLAGGRIPDLIRLSTNLDPITCTLRTALGEGPFRTPKYVRGSAIRFLVARKNSIVEPADLAEMWNMPNVTDMEIYRTRNDALLGKTLYSDFRDRFGHVICVAETSEIAANHAEAAMSTLHWHRRSTTIGKSNLASFTQWFHDYRRPSICLIRGDEPHHQFLASRLAACCNLQLDVIDKQHHIPGSTTQRRMINRLALQYHAVRRKLMGSDRLRRVMFELYDTRLDSDRTASIPSFTEMPNNWLASLPSCDLVVLKGCGIIPSRLLHDVPEPIINIHGGWLPNYRGNHCYFYAYYYEKDPRTIIGSTIHRIQPRVDTGTVLDHSRIFMRETPNVERAYCLGELIVFERLIRSMSFPQNTPIQTNSMPAMHRDFEPSHPSRLYSTRDRTLIEDVLLAFRLLRTKRARNYARNANIGTVAEKDGL